MPDDRSGPGVAPLPRPLSAAWRDELAQMIADAPVNLVSAADRPRVRDVHIDECVAVGAAVAPLPRERWVDVGTGGGLPGLVLAAQYPGVWWTLIDARAKKVQQVADFARRLALDNVTVRHGRAEDLAALPALHGTYDGAISRALGPVARAVALSRGFVERGRIVAIRGPAAREEADELGRWCDDLGVRRVAVEEIGGTMRPTWLIQLRGTGPPPARFPRARQLLLRSARGGPSDGSG